ncbi:MAG: hypothetical protein IJB48_02980 [Clostridia bacterium]|nr:hypothetical protein [Clostridia bacterium]MBQ3554151.1 hypothetical protein [Clostridia bacterium]
MKKSSFVAMMLGTVAGVFFALGMCMALLPEWNAFRPGVVFGCIGIVLGIITFFVWRKMAHKAPIQWNGKKVLFCLFGVVGALILGVGMCFCLVWENIILGTLIGLVGILMLLSLIPIAKGIKE